MSILDDYYDLFKGEFVQARLKAFGQALANGEDDLAVVVERLADDARSRLLDHPHDGIDHRIGETIGDALLYKLFFYDGLGKCVLRRRAVGHDESPRAQVDASIIADDHDQDVGELQAVELAKNGLARRRGRFAVVVGTESGTVRSQDVGIATMARIIVFLPILLDDGHSLIDRVNMMHKGEKLAPLFGIKSLADFLGNGLVGICHSVKLEIGKIRSPKRKDCGLNILTINHQKDD